MILGPRNFKDTLLSALFFLWIISVLWVPLPGFCEEKEFDLQVYLTKKQALEITFPGVDEVVKEKKWLTDEQRKEIGELSQQEVRDRRLTFFVGKKNGKSTGYMLIDHRLGKSFPITYMVVLNIDGTVRDVEIMIYREPHGWEVRYESFLSQFFGKDTESDFREINSITGATLSVNSIKGGVQKVVAAYKVLYGSAQ